MAAGVSETTVLCASLGSDVLSYNIGVEFHQVPGGHSLSLALLFSHSLSRAHALTAGVGFFPHATSRTPAQKRPPRRPLKPASVLL